MAHFFRPIAAILASLALIALPLLAILPHLSSPAQAAFVGYNGKVLFESSRGGQTDLYTVDPDGQNEIQLTTAGSSNRDGHWSPDGAKIAFASNRDGNEEIYVMDADGSSQTRLTSASGMDTQPKWSSDGSKIAFLSNRDGNQEIYVMNADGSSQTRLTDNDRYDSNPIWSPDDSKLAFASAHVGINYEVYVMDADGTNQIRLTTTNDPPNNYDLPWQWSVDGEKILFVSERGGNDEIYTIDANGTNLQQLTDTSSSDDQYPSWSHDEQRLAFIRYDNGWDTAILGLSNANGSNIETFDLAAQNVVVLDGLSWSPDQAQILTTGYTAGWANSDIYTVATDGMNLTQLSSDGNSWGPSWQPIPNVAPVAVADALSVAYQTTGSASVLANDDDEEALEGSNLTITSNPAHGDASVNSAQGKIEYTPNDGYSGSDSLTYRICDSFMLDQKCSTAVLGITVAAPGAPSLTVSKVNDQTVTPGGSYSSATSKPTFSGTASPGAEITVEIHSEPVILTTQADNEGDWSVTPTEGLPPGQHTVTISASLNGQTTTLESFVLGIQAEIPATGASRLVTQALGSIMVFSGYGLYVFDKRRKLKRHIRPII